MSGTRRRRCLGFAALAAALVAGVAALPAAASTAALVDAPAVPCRLSPCPGPTATTALLVKGGREANRMTLARAESGNIRIRDRAARLRPGRGCTHVDDHRVDCPAPTAVVLQTPLYVLPGGGPDSVRSAVRDVPVTIDGGPGDDVLHGGASSDVIFGGSGADRLLGHEGYDDLHDASLRNPGPPHPDAVPVFPPAWLSPGRGRDSFDGGAGRDTLTYEGRSGRLTIDLASRGPVSGARSERDSIRRVEDATGGSGDDRLRGSAGANGLKGGDGEDRLAGRDGSDILSGGEGSDLISGGDGRDSTIPVYDSSRYPAPDRVRCGRDEDNVGGTHPDDFVADDCERIGVITRARGYIDAAGLRSHLPLRSFVPPRVLGGTLRCSAPDACHVVLELRVHGRVGRRGTAPARGTLLGSQAVTVGGRQGPPFFDPGQEAVDLQLSTDGLQMLRRHRALYVRVGIRSQYSQPVADGYLTVLRAP